MTAVIWLMYGFFICTWVYYLELIVCATPLCQDFVREFTILPLWMEFLKCVWFIEVVSVTDELFSFPLQKTAVKECDILLACDAIHRHN